MTGKNILRFKESWFLLRCTVGRIWCHHHESMDQNGLVSTVHAAAGGKMVWGHREHQAYQSMLQTIWVLLLRTMFISLRPQFTHYLPILEMAASSMIIYIDIKSSQTYSTTMKMLVLSNSSMVFLIKWQVSVYLCISSKWYTLNSAIFFPIQKQYWELSTKWCLNAISTGAHVLVGKVYMNYMIDLRVTNSKLYRRAIQILKVIYTYAIYNMQMTCSPAIYMQWFE